MLLFYLLRLDIMYEICYKLLFHQTTAKAICSKTFDLKLLKITFNFYKTVDIQTENAF